MQRELEEWWSRCRSGYLCCASAYLRGTDTTPNQYRVEKANQMEWPPVPVSGQKQRQIHVDIERRLVTGGSSQGNDASRNHPSTSRRLCLPCLKADGARPYQTSKQPANLTASSTCQCRAGTRRPRPEAEARPDLPSVALLAHVRAQQQRQHVHRLVIRHRPLLRPPPCCLVLRPGNRG